MKKGKLNLDQINVESFVTKKHEVKQVKGGSYIGPCLVCTCANTGCTNDRMGCDDCY